MSESVDEKILRNMETVLEGISALTTVAPLGTFEPANWQKPIAGIIPENEDTDLITSYRDDSAEERGIHHEKLGVRVRVVIEDDPDNRRWELLKLLNIVHKAMMIDPSRGGYAIRTRKKGRHFLFLDEFFTHAGADILYEIEYATAAENPELQMS